MDSEQQMNLLAQQNQNNRNRIAGAPRKVLDNDYASLLNELLGFSSPTVNETALVMLAANLTEAETISILYLKGIESLRTVLSQGANIRSSQDFDPVAIWKFALSIRRDTELEFAKAVSVARSFYELRIPPRFSTPGGARIVHLRPGAVYEIASDARNNGPIDLAIQGKLTSLNPGETVEVRGATNVHINSIEPQMLTFGRIGGELPAGTLTDTMPVPEPIPTELMEVAFESKQGIEPEQPVEVAKRSRWSFFKK